MTYIDDEIASQPACWAKAADLATSGAVAGLPERGERVAVIGCGTSLYMAQAYAGLREAGGHGETDAWPASELPTGRRYDRVLAITRSGTTTEVLAALDLLADAMVPTTVLTTSATRPAARCADHAVVLDFADERSVVQTRFATTTLAFLRTSLGADITPLLAPARNAVAVELPTTALASDHVVFLGTGWTIGLANEAALKLREAARFWTESYPAMEYRHGPMSAADHGSFVWILGTPPAGLVEDIAATGAGTRWSTVDPMVEMVLVHRFAVALAEARGLDPDRPRNLARSVILG